MKLIVIEGCGMIELSKRQIDRFKAAARALEADEDEARRDDRTRKISKAKSDAEEAG
jgi:hypothetical protein